MDGGDGNGRRPGGGDGAWPLAAPPWASRKRARVADGADGDGTMGDAGELERPLLVRRPRLQPEEETTVATADMAVVGGLADLRERQGGDDGAPVIMGAAVTPTPTGNDYVAVSEVADGNDNDDMVTALAVTSSEVDGGPEAAMEATEDSNTDDEDLHQLTMAAVAGVGVAAAAHDAALGAFMAAELSYEDIQQLVFHSAREQKPAIVDRILRIVKRSRDGPELMHRLVLAEDESGLTLLMIAIRYGMLDLCELLVHEGADVNQCNDKRPFALLLASQKGHEDSTRFLLTHGASDESKNMALIPAAHFGHLEVVRLLLEFGADQNYSNKKGTTPLMRAAQEGRSEVVQFLIDKGAKACAANNEGMTALMLAAQRGHAEIATRLIRSGSDVNTQTRQGSTALLLAAKRGHTAAVEALLTAGADIFLKDDRDKTAAETAHRRGHVDLFLKITVSNQLRLMREGLRRERYEDLMRLSHLYVLHRAEFAPAIKSPRRRSLHDLLDRTMKLPRPLLQSIAKFLPLCQVWDRQLKYLIYEATFQPSRVVHQGIRMIDDILTTVALELRPTLHPFRPVDISPSTWCGQLALLRDNVEFRDLFLRECTASLGTDMLMKLRKMADLQGAMASYPVGSSIQFGHDVAQDVVIILNELLNWNVARKRFDLLT